VGAGALVAASAMVPNDTQIPPLAMALGIPCKIRENAVEVGAFDYAVELYIQDGHMYRSELRRLSD
jgi:carbonic anhydrase/acetyltransferase-like protein (isoleucine patch superfamily)